MRHPARLLLALIPVLLVLVASACTGDELARRRDDGSLLYVAIGASDAVGTGARNPAQDGWVATLHQKMPSGTRLANLGIGGLQTHQALDQVLPVAVDLQPNIVTVWLAVNDLASGVPLESYQADLDTLLRALSQQTKARVYVANIPDLTALNAFREQPQEELTAEVQRWNAAIGATTAANGATLIDLYNGWSELHDNKSLISRDGLHPSTAGHRRLAEIFWQQISATLARP